jgi:CheY-like chemotaxis protein
MTARPLLIVDDSDDDLFFARRAHRLAGMPVPLVCLESGEQMLGYHEGMLSGDNAVPVAILLDINMPRLNGFATYEQLVSAAGGQAPAPVWFLTGSDDPEDHRVAHELGARGLLTKPDSVRDLAGLLASVWEQVSAS